MFDVVSNTSFDVTVDLTWTAYGERRHDNFNSHYNFEGYHFVYDHIGAFQFAEVSGTVSDGTTNLTPEFSQIAGSIFKGRTAIVSHSCD
ncbi:MAG TPA: hypothetical protein VFR47_29820 [Anaerolineales bacterium]|nr:hypothetical protein [Anaerolineales bacterium]